MLKPLEELLRRGQADGEFAEFDVRAMAWMIRNLIDGTTKPRLLDPAFDFDSYIGELAGLVDRATRRAAP